MTQTLIQTAPGPWTVLIPSDSEQVSVVDANQNVIALVEGVDNAAIMASAQTMFDALIAVHEIIDDGENIPHEEKLELIEDAISLAFQKVAAESDI